MWRERVEFPELQKKSEELYAKYRDLFGIGEVLIEDHASGQSLIQSLKRFTTIPVLAIKADGDKIARANAATPLIAAWRVYLPDPSLAPWVSDFTDELAAFPNGEHSDIVDSVSMFLNYIRKPIFQRQYIGGSNAARQKKSTGNKPYKLFGPDMGIPLSKLGRIR